MRKRRADRSAFTIVEMLVATALILFIMAIIAQAFGSASKTFNALRTAGELQERLRTVTSVVRRDLAAEHFDGPYISGRGGPRLGDQRLDRRGWMPPPCGYFEIRQDGPSVLEPSGNATPDPEQLWSTRAVTHSMRFTVKLPESSATELFTANAPALFSNDPRCNAFVIPNSTILYSRWAEVYYFLVKTGDQTTSGLDLHSLRRRVRVHLPKTVDFDVPQTTAQRVLAEFANGNYPDLLPPEAVGPSPINPGNVILRAYGVGDLNRPRVDMQNGNNIVYTPARMPLNTAHPTGDDILATDVLSFEIKAAWLQNPEFELLKQGSSPPIRAYGTPPGNPTNNYVGLSEAPFEDLPRSTINPSYQATTGFDTWYYPTLVNMPPPMTTVTPSDSVDFGQPQSFLNSAPGAFPQFANPPLRVNIRAVQIKVRVWDPKTEQSRQVSVLQEV